MDQLHKIEQALHRSGLDITLGDDSLFFKPEDDIDQVLLDLNTLDDKFWQQLSEVKLTIYDLVSVTYLEISVEDIIKKKPEVKDMIILVGELTYMQARLLLQLMPDSSFNPILMWHLYTYHQYDKLIKCQNGKSSVDYYTLEIMVKNKITENYLVKILNF